MIGAGVDMIFDMRVRDLENLLRAAGACEAAPFKGTTDTTAVTWIKLNAIKDDCIWSTPSAYGCRIRK
ncbi:hypothetical protein Rhsp01_56710 [Rhizobium sp. NBRC 114257]|nr:hypothetical protein Rhsp01_56710 [Rhizobium sp. NBRC 114257]